MQFNLKKCNFLYWNNLIQYKKVFIPYSKKKRIVLFGSNIEPVLNEILTDECFNQLQNLA